MAKLIVKSPYIKCGGGGSAGGYMKYIATRERVELIHDDRPPTRKQEQLISKLTKDFPNTRSLYEYDSYVSKPTKANASAFITLALESNWEDIQRSEQYMKYIATRPRVERLGAHGLFGDEDAVDLDSAMAELDTYTGNVWTHILSLKREDAARLGYDNAAAWRDLLRTNRNEIAAAMNIPTKDFRWYAAFHDEGDHPHVHMMAWSVKPGQAYLNTEGIRKIKSELTNQIFRHEMLHLYEQKSESRDELVRQSRKAVRALAREIRSNLCADPAVEQLMQTLVMELGTVQGKKSYGYLPKKVKATVDEIVDQLEHIPVVKKCYDQWLDYQWQVDSYYKDKPKEHPPLSRQKEFRQIKNAVIREAERVRLGEVTFEDREMEDGPEEEYGYSYEYWQLKEIVLDDEYSMGERDAAVAELTDLAKGGDVHAQHLLGTLWRDGPLLTPDWVNARHWFAKAAEQGHAAAQYALGKLYLSGDVEVHDVERGIYWLEAAAENGHDSASYRLGKEYLRGKIVEKDADKAVQFFSQAAEVGNPYTQYMLGKLYLAGEGVPQDQKQALYWFSLSASRGNSYAQFFLDRMEQGMSCFATHPDQTESPFVAPSLMLSVSRLLHHMSRIFMETTPPPANTGGIQIDRKRLEQLREKKIAAGHKPDDHAEQTYAGPTMSM